MMPSNRPVSHTSELDGHSVIRSFAHSDSSIRTKEAIGRLTSRSTQSKPTHVYSGPPALSSSMALLSSLLESAELNVSGGERPEPSVGELNPHSIDQPHGACSGNENAALLGKQFATTNVSHDPAVEALVLSGGGMRAAFFHLGILLYLALANELKAVRLIVSVSGGSILSGHFLKYWNRATADLQGFTQVSKEFISFTRGNIRNSVFRPWLWSRLLWYPCFFLAIPKRTPNDSGPV